MLSDDSIENRHAAPGVNSRSMTAAQSAAELEVLKGIDSVYFSEGEVDPARHVLSTAPPPHDEPALERLFETLKKQQQVVSGKALHLISQERDNCDREFAEVQKIRDQLSDALQKCRETRKSLRSASDNITISTFAILANYRKRQMLKSILKSIELLRQLSGVQKDATDLVNKREYEQAVALILNSLKSAAAHKEFTCIGELTVKLKNTLAVTEDKLDSTLAMLCYNFDEMVFRKLRNAYALLGKTQDSMDQLHMYYSSAINETSLNAVKEHNEGKCDGKFQELCQAVPMSQTAACLLKLCENLFFVMKSYYLLVQWCDRNDETSKSDNALDIERNVSREYIRQKLKGGLTRIWHDVQSKVSTFLKSFGLEDHPFERFVQMLGVLRKLTLTAEVFCGDKSDLLHDFIKTHSVAFIKNYHRGRMDELKLFLENEGWEQCPVKQHFTLLDLHEFKQFKSRVRPSGQSEVSVCKSHSEGTSSVTSQDDSVYVTKFFNSKSKHSPFDMFRDANVTNDDIFGLEHLSSDSSDTDDEPDEIRDHYDDDDTGKVSPSKVRNVVIVTNTTLSVLRNCGQYLQICRYLPQISLDIIVLMNQLFDYYFYAVHLYFTANLDVASTTLYSSKLNAILKRISNNIDTNGSGDEKTFPVPEMPNHLDLTSEETLHGLSERIVGVESVIFLAKQYEMLQPYLETIVAPHQKMILEHFKEKTLQVVTELRMPVYMCSASKAVDAKTSLIAISQIRWDVKTVAEEHSPYVDTILRRIQIFAMRLDSVADAVTLNHEIVASIWSMLSKFVVHLLVEGYSNATKCSNGGRSLMQLDYRQLFTKLEKICSMKPMPYQEYLDVYVKAYYLPRGELETFLKERKEYSTKHLAALVSSACENRRDRQELMSALESREA